MVLFIAKQLLYEITFSNVNLRSYLCSNRVL